MTTFSFLDDYSEGAHPDILRALTESNYVQQAPYGEDTYSADATNRIKAHLGRKFNGSIHYVASGTMANIVAISSCLRPHEAVIAVGSGHIVVREAGAIEATGHKLITVPAVDGKLTPESIEAALSDNAHFPHMAKPRLVYISNATETGTVYTLPELRAISALGVPSTKKARSASYWRWVALAGSRKTWERSVSFFTLLVNMLPKCHFGGVL